VEVCMVYNITEAFVGRVLTKFKTLLANKQQSLNEESSNTLLTSSSSAHQSLSTSMPLKPGQIAPTAVSIAYSPPPQRTMDTSSSPPISNSHSHNTETISEVDSDDANSDSESDSVIGDMDVTFMIGGKEPTKDS